jgi:hypothetical protein
MAPEINHHAMNYELKAPSLRIRKSQVHVSEPIGSMVNRNDIMAKKSEIVSVMNWGYPGYLTESEYDIFIKFREEVYSRNDEFRATVFPFRDAHEEETYALCRWLRARKYDLHKTIQMVEEAVECTRIPRKNKFYPCPNEALGCESSLYTSFYPQLYFGTSKNGSPVFISKPGVINMTGIECVTSLPGILNFHWNAMMHEFAQKLKTEYESSNGSFKRYECTCILDLKDLTHSQIGKRPLNLIKSQTFIDSLCFPETLNRMVIINAPSFFTVSWKLIKSWIDVRTANKIDIVGTNAAKIEKKLKEIISDHNLPSDYGGVGTSTVDYMQDEMIRQYNNSNNNKSQKIVSQEEHILHVRHSTIHKVVVKKNEKIKLSVFTKSAVGGMLSIKDSQGKLLSCIPSGGIRIYHKGSSQEEDDQEFPSRYNLEDMGVILSQPGSYDVMIESNGGRFSAQNFLLVALSFVELADNDIRTPDRKPSLSNASPAISSNSLGVGILDESRKLVQFCPSPARPVYNDQTMTVVNSPPRITGYSCGFFCP